LDNLSSSTADDATVPGTTNETARPGPAHLVVWFDGSSQPSSELLGGKCSGLVEMTAAGLAVPPGFAVTTVAHQQHPEPSAPLAGPVAHAVIEAYQELGRRAESPDPPVAVRSSGQSEDGQDASFAGQFDTYLSITGQDAVLDAVRRVWASSLASRTLSYRKERDLGQEFTPMCVGVQLMVDARSAGVMFTLDPRTGDRSRIVIESSWGLGEAVVGGEVRPDRFSVNKVTGTMTMEELGTKEVEHRFDPATGGVVERPVEARRRSARSLTDEEVHELVRLGKQIERLRGAPQDIEWAIDPAGNLFLLQVRPETVWSAKRQAQDGPPARRRGALECVVAQLSGGS
jgi:pyruvate, water dikinase